MFVILFLASVFLGSLAGCGGGEHATTLFTR
jgi:hypothetical protein